MCGVAAVLDLRGAPVDPAELAAMVAAIRHRGPDADGVWTEGPVGLGAARLAVMDPSAAGNQPMVSSDGAVALAYNGEIYNHRELRVELRGRGHAFRSHGDTEVVLAAYEEWGPACVERLEGMFAFAVWDAGRRELFAARDRFGMKPLYYAESGGRLLVGSEIKALLAAGLSVAVDPDALVEYFTFQNVLSDRTLFAGVRMLPAGHTLQAGPGGTRVTQYWDLELAPDEGPSAGDWEEQLREAFEAAVTRHVVSDRPVGSYLSGGMDSGSIVAVASGKVPRLATITGGFDLTSVTGLELVFDERADAEVVSGIFGTDHYVTVMHAGDMARVLPELVWHLEDLRLGMAYQNHYAARLASRLVTVVLAGGGGDELFGGYPWRYDLVAGLDDPGAFERAHYGYWSRLVGDDARARFFSPRVLAATDPERPLAAYRHAIAPAEGLDPVARALYFETKTFLHGLLVIEDKLSMAHGLESRLPFLDAGMVEIARRLPTRFKHDGPAGKPLLRRTMQGLLPERIVQKPKQGFSPPDQSWYRGPTMDYLKQILLDPRTLERGYFRPESVTALLDEHLTGRHNHRLLIWSLLCFEWWNRLFVDGDPHGAAEQPQARAGSGARIDTRTSRA